MTVKEFYNWCKKMDCLDYELGVNSEDPNYYGFVSINEIIVDDDCEIVSI